MFVDKLKPHAGSVQHYLVNGKSPDVGSVMRFPALAATLKAIAAGGAKAFYQGPIARRYRRNRSGGGPACSPPRTWRVTRATSLRRSRRIIAGSMWSSCRRTGRD